MFAEVSSGFLANDRLVAPGVLYRRSYLRASAAAFVRHQNCTLSAGPVLSFVTVRFGVRREVTRAPANEDSRRASGRFPVDRFANTGRTGRRLTRSGRGP